MGYSEFDRKIQEVFAEFAIDKGLVRRLGATGDDRHVPSYVMDWIVTHNAKAHQSTGAIEQAVRGFVAKHLPPKGDKQRIRWLLANDEKPVLLDAISVTVKLGKEVQYFATIDCLDESKALIDPSIIEKNQGLLQGSTWGAVKICYDGSPEGGGIRIIDFKPMQTGRISLDVFRECRQAFTVEEWLDLIIRTLGLRAFDVCRIGETVDAVPVDSAGAEPHEFDGVGASGVGKILHLQQRQPPCVADGGRDYGTRAVLQPAEEGAGTAHAF